ncbi:RTA1 like protein [Schizosaccharomyces cryophilus OY26]|uniref:RTA1 like protein n=1 Tax=Schizosaccharomyces cryophilus (strain OY26 / ATCC MYA-4695 / CBS 11777 / NBRC 106824 / NRRL Y48691) TaxID=653667 RepID=S9X7H1_SCHCR|nr:RTA1 like protein [Schizosaccharomyces cryophilus OY26]EPY53042.1 RTA1 like protein [Schizosaccharomyces cryophilus OY26]
MSRTHLNNEDLFGYIPNATWAKAATGLLCVACLLHIAAFIKSPKSVAWVVIIGTLGEIGGWLCRLYANYRVQTATFFIFQFLVLLVAPIFYSAVLYVLLYRWSLHYGPQFSLLRPKYYVAIFVTADVIAFIVQIAGGGLSNNDTNPKLGFYIALAGVIFQLVCTVLFCVLQLIFVISVIRVRPVRVVPGSYALYSPRTKLRDLSFLCLTISTIAVLVRIIYRTAEFADNDKFKGSELWFDILDFVPMFITALFLAPALYPSIYKPVNSGAPERLYSHSSQDLSMDEERSILK